MIHTLVQYCSGPKLSPPHVLSPEDLPASGVAYKWAATQPVSLAVILHFQVPFPENY